eukprot:3111119-Pyramimonas_sp.AAC.3
MHSPLRPLQPDLQSAVGAEGPCRLHLTILPLLRVNPSLLHVPQASSPDRTTPVVRKSTPVVRKSTPVVRESTPVLRESTPAVRESTPVV